MKSKEKSIFKRYLASLCILMKLAQMIIYVLFMGSLKFENVRLTFKKQRLSTIAGYKTYTICVSNHSS